MNFKVEVQSRVFIWERLLDQTYWHEENFHF